MNCLRVFSLLFKSGEKSFAFIWLKWKNCWRLITNFACKLIHVITPHVYSFSFSVKMIKHKIHMNFFTTFVLSTICPQVLNSDRRYLFVDVECDWTGTADTCLLAIMEDDLVWLWHMYSCERDSKRYNRPVPSCDSITYRADFGTLWKMPQTSICLCVL